jgi:hypothetical protein
MVTRDVETVHRTRVGRRVAQLEEEVLAEQLQATLWARPAARKAQGGRGALPASDAPVCDRPELVEHIRALLVPGEFLHAVFDLKGRGPAFVAATSRRVILCERRTHAILTLPYTRVVAVGLRDTADEFAARGLVTTKVVLMTAASAYDFEVQTSEAAQILHELIVRYLF